MRYPSSAYARRALVRGAASSLAVIGLTATAVAATGTAVASQRTQARGPVLVHFVLFSNASNTQGAQAYIDNPATNGKPHALLFVTPNWNPNNTSVGRYINHPIGVLYSRTFGKWAVFNEDLTQMGRGRAFNILVVPHATTNAFTVTATGSNTNGDSVFINRPVTNGHSNAVLQVTQNWNPGGTISGLYNPHNIGVWYARPQWGIFEQDQVSMIPGASFNVLVGTSGTGGAATVLHATHSNTHLNFTLLNNRNTNNNSRAMVFATPNFNPGGIGGTLDDSPIGVRYDKHVSPHKWGPFNQNLHNMPLGAAFNLLIFRTR